MEVSDTLISATNGSPVVHYWNTNHPQHAVTTLMTYFCWLIFSIFTTSEAESRKYPELVIFFGASRLNSHFLRLPYIRIGNCLVYMAGTIACNGALFQYRITGIGVVTTR